MEPQKKSNGALIGSIVVILILVLGGVYFWTVKMDKVSIDPNQQKALDQQEAAIIEADTALGSIESDINTSGVETINLESVVNEVK